MLKAGFAALQTWGDELMPPNGAWLTKNGGQLIQQVLV